MFVDGGVSKRDPHTPNGPQLLLLTLCPGAQPNQTGGGLPAQAESNWAQPPAHYSRIRSVEETKVSNLNSAADSLCDLDETLDFSGPYFPLRRES